MWRGSRRARCRSDSAFFWTDSEQQRLAAKFLFDRCASSPMILYIRAGKRGLSSLRRPVGMGHIVLGRASFSE